MKNEDDRTESSRSGEVVAWALYDWANSAYATTVLAGFFPVFFKSYWCEGLSTIQSTSRLGATHAVASILAAFSALVIGVYAARPGRFRGAFLLAILLGAGATCVLASVPRGAWLAASFLCILSQLGFSSSLVCYDSLLPTVSRGRSAERVSALGYALGYLGGGLQFLLCIVLYKDPGLFGMNDSASAVRISFAFVGLWWLVFSLPLMLSRNTPAHEVSEQSDTFLSLLRRLRCSLSTNRLPAVFLLGYWLYIDGVNSVVKMAIDYGLSKGLQPSDLITALLVTQFVGFPATILFGILGGRMGAKRAVLLGIFGYCLITIWASLLTSSKEFYALAVCVGLLQGGVQSLSRAFFTKLIPAEQASELFGVFNMVSKFASILGPLLIASVASATGRHEFGVLSLLILFFSGAALLSRIPEVRPPASRIV